MEEIRRTKYLYGKTWLLIFRHIASSVKFNENTCLHANENGKYSELGSISSLFLINGYYEFILQYPEIGEIAWKQNKSPLDITESDISKDDVGLIITRNRYNFTKFKGMMRSTRCTCFDCDNNTISQYWFAIGQTHEEFSDIPGPRYYRNGEIIESFVKEVQLWIRIPSQNHSCQQRKSTISCTVILLISVCS